MKTAIVVNDKFDAIVEEIKATFTERVYNAREEIILAHWETGKIINAYVKENKGLKVTALVQSLTDRGAGKERTLWDCVKFYEKFPTYRNIDSLGHGKNISWNKIKLALGPAKEEETPDRKVAIFEVSADEWDAARSIACKEGDELNIESSDATVRLVIV